LRERAIKDHAVSRRNKRKEANGVILIGGNTIILCAIVSIIEFFGLAVPGRAQKIITGEFNLSHEVRWENAVLPMGDYIYYVDTELRPAVVRVEQKGGGFSRTFVPIAVLRPGTKPDSGIDLALNGSGMYVMSLRLDRLQGEFDFSAPDPRAESDDVAEGQETSFSSVRAQGYLTIFNPNHEKLSLEEAEKLYWKACQAVEREFNRSTPIRPRLVLRLGASNNLLRYPTREIQLKKWDQHRFADAVVDAALQEMVRPDERAKLSDAAVREAGATVHICELKACAN
jgi:hypothetical protein